MKKMISRITFIYTFAFLVGSLFSCSNSDDLRKERFSQQPDKKIEEVSTYSDSVKTIVYPQVKKCLNTKKHQSMDTTYWYCTDRDNNISCYLLEVTIDSDKYIEYYVLSNNNIAYAFEGIAYNYSDTANLRLWNCEYFISENNVVNYSSLGLGKTEDENWNPNSIIEQWKRRQKIFTKFD